MNETSKIPDGVISKLRGAIALAEQSTSVAEAHEAAKKVQMLIEKYNIDLRDIDLAANGDKHVIEKNWYSTGKNRNNSAASLANVLGQNNFVSTFSSERWLKDEAENKWYPIFTLVFVGREYNVDTVMDLFIRMLATMNKIADDDFQQYTTDGGREHGKSWKHSFRLGFVSGLAQKLREERAAFLKQQSEISGRTGRELIISLDKENQEYLKAHYKLTDTPGSHIKNSAAYHAGFERGRDTSTKPQVN